MRMDSVPLSILSRSLFRKAALLLLAAGLALAARTAVAQELAITFDDLPAHSVLPAGTTRLEVAEAIIRALSVAGVPPTYGFVNGTRLVEHPDDAAVLDRWRASGNLLGNHTWSHMDLNEHSAAEFETDINRNEPVILDRMKGLDWRWLRFAYLAEGDTTSKRDAVRAYLASHRYRMAAVTMSFGDYLWNEPYARCTAKGEPESIALLERSYLQAASDDVAYRREMASKLFGHDIPYVLLMHIGAFDAHMLPHLLAQYRAEGLHFVSLAKAESDPFYASDTDPSLPGAPDTLEASTALHHLSIISHAAQGPPPESLCR